MPSQRLVRLAFFFSLFTNLLLLTGPLFLLQIYDRVLASRSEETLVALFGLVVLLYTHYGILDFARGRLMARVGAQIQHHYGPRIFDAVLRDRAINGGRCSRDITPGDLESIRDLYASPLVLVLFDLPWTPIFLAAIFIFHPMLGWLALAGAAALVMAAFCNQYTTRQAVGLARAVGSQAAAKAHHVWESSGFVRAQGMSGALRERWHGLQSGALVHALGAHDRSGAFSAFTKAFRMLLQSAILALGAWLVLRQELTAGAMIAASILMGRALAPIETVLPQWSVFQRARAARRRLEQLLAESPEGPSLTLLPNQDAAIQVRDVSVMPSGHNRPILRSVRLDVAPGEALGVLGDSGAGKTTLARVLLGIQEPATGEVWLGGTAIRRYAPERFGNLVGYLPQEIQFFDGTVAENIARMSLSLEPAAIVSAAQKARVHQVILELPNGYDTRIGPTDTQLSCGQKQRLALARALYGDPILLVLDEPNSALDFDGSMALNEAIAAVKAADGSVIVMTHRPGAITQCDNLLVLERGRVAACGPRDEIIWSMLKNSKNVQYAVSRERTG